MFRIFALLVITFVSGVCNAVEESITVPMAYRIQIQQDLSNSELNDFEEVFSFLDKKLPIEIREGLESSFNEVIPIDSSLDGLESGVITILCNEYRRLGIPQESVEDYVAGTYLNLREDLISLLYLTEKNSFTDIFTANGLKDPQGMLNVVIAKYAAYLSDIDISLDSLIRSEMKL